MVSRLANELILSSIVGGINEKKYHCVCAYDWVVKERSLLVMFKLQFIEIKSLNI